MKNKPEQFLLDFAESIKSEREEAEAEIARLSEINNKAKEILDGKEYYEVQNIVTKTEPASTYKTEKGRKAGLGAVWIWCLVIGAIIGGVLVPHISDSPTVQPNYNQCLSDYIYDNPVKDNKYQELVNALWACKVYQEGDS
jgi:hypothetical protein